MQASQHVLNLLPTPINTWPPEWASLYNSILQLLGKYPQSGEVQALARRFYDMVNCGWNASDTGHVLGHLRHDVQHFEAALLHRQQQHAQQQQRQQPPNTQSYITSQELNMALQSRSKDVVHVLQFFCDMLGYPQDVGREYATARGSPVYLYNLAAKIWNLMRENSLPARTQRQLTDSAKQVIVQHLQNILDTYSKQIPTNAGMGGQQDRGGKFSEAWMRNALGMYGSDGNALAKWILEKFKLDETKLRSVYGAAMPLIANMRFFFLYGGNAPALRLDYERCLSMMDSGALIALGHALQTMNSGLTFFEMKWAEYGGLLNNARNKELTYPLSKDDIMRLYYSYWTAPSGSGQTVEQLYADFLNRICTMLKLTKANTGNIITIDASKDSIAQAAKFIALKIHSDKQWKEEILTEDARRCVVNMITPIRSDVSKNGRLDLFYMSEPMICIGCNKMIIQ